MRRKEKGKESWKKDRERTESALRGRNERKQKGIESYQGRGGKKKNGSWEESLLRGGREAGKASVWGEQRGCGEEDQTQFQGFFFEGIYLKQLTSNPNP